MFQRWCLIPGGLDSCGFSTRLVRFFGQEYATMILVIQQVDFKVVMDEDGYFVAALLLLQVVS